MVRMEEEMKLAVECWSKHSPSLGSSQMRSKQTREWRSWNPESLFTRLSSFQLRPCLHAVGKGVQAINYLTEKRKSWVATFLVRRRFATGAQGLC